MKKRILSIILSIVMIPSTAFAATPVNVLALGDSITAGYGLKAPETERFTSLLGNNCIVTNKAVNGNTTAGILKQLQTEKISTQMVATADVITITIGGNDIMSAFYSKTAEKYNAKYHASITAKDVSTVLNKCSSSNLMQCRPVLSIAEQILNKDSKDYLLNTPVFTEAINNYHQNMTEITALLRQANPDVRIIVATQYNPYAEFKGDSLLHSFYNGIEECISRLNHTIIENASVQGYIVANIKPAFETSYSKINDLYNADPKIKSINLDFHPNANGHVILSEVFKAVITENINSNETIISDINSFTDISSDAYYAEAVKWATTNDITSGTSETTFSPDATCTRGQVMTFLWRSFGSPAPRNIRTVFTDVPADSYYHDAILWAVENGISAGTSETTFSPDAECSRAQITTILWRAQKSPVVSARNRFHDVSADSYYSNAVLWATSKGIASGTSDTTFSPDAECTRAQIVTFLWRFINNQ